MPRPTLPPVVARRIDTLRTRRFLSQIAPPTSHYLQAYGATVRHGPLEGLRYLPDSESGSGDLVSKLLGAYEAELHPVLERWIASGATRVIDVGSAEGYYAVGLAHAMPAATVYAYDIDPIARDRCQALAEHNDVADRVVIGGACTPETLAEHPASDVLLLSDCEGYERTLLDPGVAPVLRGWSILVELHEFLDAGITDVLRQRFAETHDVEVVEGERRDGGRYPELADLEPRRRARLLSENRPGHMRWMALWPR